MWCWRCFRFTEAQVERSFITDAETIPDVVYRTAGTIPLLTLKIVVCKRCGYFRKLKVEKMGTIKCNTKEQLKELKEQPIA
jgi:hypothetical protein